MPETEGAAGRAPDSARSRQRSSRAMLRAVGGYSLIEEGDRILVAVSGGKDSYALLDLLWAARRKAPVHFDLIACHLDQGQPGHDPAPLRDWLDRLGVPFEIVSQVMLGALKNVRPSHLLDVEVAEAWTAQAGNYPPRR